ncbi:unnamed protein product [Closterium sp. NIES-53]
MGCRTCVATSHQWIQQGRLASVIGDNMSASCVAHLKLTHHKEAQFGRSSSFEAFRARLRCAGVSSSTRHGGIAPLPSPLRGICTSCVTGLRTVSLMLILVRSKLDVCADHNLLCYKE